MDMNQEVIRIKGIKKIYKVGNQEVRALNGIDIRINKNEYVAIMGPSGSGKSTMMNILGCLDSPSEGEYILNGTDVSKMDDNDLAVIRNKEIGLYSSHLTFSEIYGFGQRRFTFDLFRRIRQNREERARVAIENV